MFARELLMTEDYEQIQEVYICFVPIVRGKVESNKATGNMTHMLDSRWWIRVY